MKLNSLVVGLVLVGLGWMASKGRETEPTVARVEPVVARRSVPEVADYGVRSQVVPGSIYDGDTLRVVMNGVETKIRFCGIDAPEMKQAGGKESRDYLRSLVAQAGGEVWVREIEQDRYGRTVAELTAETGSGPVLLNAAMVQAGQAYHYERYSGDCLGREAIASGEQLAQSQKLGLWLMDGMKPWDYRRIEQ